MLHVVVCTMIIPASRQALYLVYISSHLATSPTNVVLTSLLSGTASRLADPLPMSHALMPPTTDSRPNSSGRLSICSRGPGGPNEIPDRPTPSECGENQLTGRAARND